MNDISKDYECRLVFVELNDFEPGDTIEASTTIVIKQARAHTILSQSSGSSVKDREFVTQFFNC